MARTFFDVRYRLDGIDRYLFIFSNDQDGVVVDEQRFVLGFRTLGQMRAYAARHGIDLMDGPPLHYDLDVLKRWLARPRRATVDWLLFLNAWNLFADVASSVGDTTFDQDRRRTARIYGKLFWGNNLPAVTPPGKYYVPIWSRREVRRMAAELGAGLQLFRRVVRLAQSSG